MPTFKGASGGNPDATNLARWFEALAKRDPTLHSELSNRLRPPAAPADDITSEATASLDDARQVVLTLETIVRAGRPALFVKNHHIVFDDIPSDAVAQVIIDRLKIAAPTIEAVLPLIGRIDVGNHPSALTYVGTGWLVEQNVVVTNRHVAEFVARQGGSSFVFRAGRFGDPLNVSIDYRREAGAPGKDVAPVSGVIWIEPDYKGPDIAFLKIGERQDATHRGWIAIAEQDAAPGTEVVVVGYPARAPISIVPDQAWMDRIYGGAYDVKRVAPGMVGDMNRGWTTHDCTTLGGNSGSVVLDAKTGQAVALHFAGLYLVENYAVPASAIRRYKRERPWQGLGSSSSATTSPEHSRPPSSAPPAQVKTTAPGRVSITIPLTITVSLGEMGTDATRLDSAQTTSLDEAAHRLFMNQRGNGVFAVKPGYLIDVDRLSDVDCLVLKANPVRFDEVRASAPPTFQGYPVDVRPASVDDLVAISDVVTEAVSSISYNDGDRTGPGFSFETVVEKMKGLIHVGPERSWTVLSEYLSGTEHKLVASMYEFHAKHVADALEKELDDGASLQLVLATQSRDPKSARVAAGDFERGALFEQWRREFGRKFKSVFVPLGADGLVANAYHIKVTVRDDRTVWLSSGNWKNTSQPVITAESLNDPKVTSRAGNREWHVLLESPTLAERFQNHIMADYERSLALGGEAEAVEAQVWVDVPEAVLEGPDFEAVATRVLDPLPIDRQVRVKPLLTPDHKGRVYSEAVIDLIRSARKQLLFQNQYIKMAGAASGFLKALVDALVDRAKRIDDFRIILRSGDSLVDDVSALKRRGVDVATSVRKLTNTHTKGIVVDGMKALVGSHNWSAPGVTLNRDASLIFDDSEIAQYYAQAFEIDWDRARSAISAKETPESVPRLASDLEPPLGFKRMTLSEYLEG
jgi:phosphatidylserine/phosphatidylglycerophosphate/cardiolipin synthase-like enzyme/V8-like Glu-specific endopeptidase